MTALLRLCFAILLAADWAAAAEEKISTGDENECLTGAVLNQLNQMARELQQLSDQQQVQSERLDQVQQQSNQVPQLSDQLQQQSQQVESLQSQVSLVEEVQEGNTASIGALNSSSHPKQAAFTATYSSHAVLNVGSGGTLKYNTIITNIGNGYDPLTGHFTAPYSGLYSFFANMRRRDKRHEQIELGIYKEDTKLVSFHTESSADPWENGSGFTTTHLDKGESTYVRQHSGGTFVEDGPFTTFSGMLVAAD